MSYQDIKLKILLPAELIPLGSTVTKAYGASSYILKNEIRLYKEEGGTQVIQAEDDCRFLAGANGNVNVVPGDRQVMWQTTVEALEDWLDNLREAEEGDQ